MELNYDKNNWKVEKENDKINIYVKKDNYWEQVSSEAFYTQRQFDNIIKEFQKTKEIKISKF